MDGDDASIIAVPSNTDMKVIPIEEGEDIHDYETLWPSEAKVCTSVSPSISLSLHLSFSLQFAFSLFLSLLSCTSCSLVHVHTPRHAADFVADATCADAERVPGVPAPRVTCAPRVAAPHQRKDLLEDPQLARRCCCSTTWAGPHVSRRPLPQAHVTSHAPSIHGTGPCHAGGRD